MNRIRNIAAVVLGATLAVGAAGMASAQSTETAPKSDTAPKQLAQEKFDKEKVVLKDRIQDGIGSAEANIDALKRLEDTDKGAIKDRDKDMGKKLSDLRDTLKKDLDKIDKATPADWTTVHTSVMKDLGSMDQQLKVATNITHVAPPTGAAQKQPESAPVPKPVQPQPKAP
jgi:hypothetical protein